MGLPQNTSQRSILTTVLIYHIKTMLFSSNVTIWLVVKLKFNYPVIQLNVNGLMTIAMQIQLDRWSAVTLTTYWLYSPFDS